VRLGNHTEKTTGNQNTPLPRKRALQSAGICNAEIEETRSFRASLACENRARVASLAQETASALRVRPRDETSWAEVLSAPLLNYHSFPVVGPWPHRDGDYRIGSDFWKFYLIKTDFTLGEPVSLVNMFRLFRLERIVLVFRVWTQSVDEQHLINSQGQHVCDALLSISNSTHFMVYLTLVMSYH